ncbi:conserved hypothetical protein [Rhodospirillum centenum SW]|uniref:Uncharacterized protein n=2 Tax=Rhodospirillum centenum TaxID=34018 RepID=B6IW09_RHOCS|nr:conserved hypothetical protein [Rhodospirillum centenum SW]
MDATLSSPATPSAPTRPRLTPGIPAGGIVALAVTAGIVGWGLLVGTPAETDDHRLSATLHIAPTPPVPPTPPTPPTPPARPAPPAASMAAPGVIVIDPEQIARSVQDALRSVDIDSIRRAAEAARQQAEQIRQQAGTSSSNWEWRTHDAGAQGKSASDGEDRLAASFTAPAGVRLVDVRGDITVEVSTRTDKVRVEVDDGASGLRTDVTDGALTLIGNGGTAPPVGVRLTLPEGADLTLASFAGDLSLTGRQAGAVTVDLQQGDVSLERVRSADIRVLASGSVSVNRVEGALTFASLGSAELSVERAGSAALEVKGHASVSLSRVENGLTLALPGYAEIDVGRMDGPLKTAFAGAGRVQIGGGDASPFQVAVTGAGDFSFGGTAHDPVIFNAGTGSIHIEHHTGEPRMQRVGRGSVVIGSD